MTPPRHLKLLHGNFLELGPDRDKFVADLVTDARLADNGDLTEALTGDWRKRLMAAWLIGVDRRERFRAELTRLLLDSELTYAGQGYAFALARFGDADALASYLDRYLAERRHYDQPWVLGALSLVDGERAAGYLVPGGPWDRWNQGRFEPDVFRTIFADVYRLIPG